MELLVAAGGQVFRIPGSAGDLITKSVALQPRRIGEKSNCSILQIVRLVAEGKPREPGEGDSADCGHSPHSSRQLPRCYVTHDGPAAVNTVRCSRAALAAALLAG